MFENWTTWPRQCSLRMHIHTSFIHGRSTLKDDCEHFWDGLVREIKDKCKMMRRLSMFTIDDWLWLNIALWAALWKQTPQMLYGKVQLKVLCVDEKTTACILLKDPKKTSSMINCIDNKQIQKNYMDWGTPNSKLLLSLMVKASKLSELNPMFGVVVSKICRWSNQIKRISNHEYTGIQTSASALGEQFLPSRPLEEDKQQRFEDK